MLTLFTIPKAFEGPFKDLQMNALRSWTFLTPQVEILIMGDDPGVAEAAAYFGFRHLSLPEKSEYGTPLYSAAFERAERAAANPVVCNINADIILLDDFMPTIVPLIRRLTGRPFMLLGRRFDVELPTGPLDFSGGWQARLREDVLRRGRRHGRTGVDYCVFTPGLFSGMPPFGIGRRGPDNWWLHRAVTSGAAVVDVTRQILAVHPHHDYSHVRGGWETIQHGEERLKMAEAVGTYATAYSFYDVPYVVGRGGAIRRKITLYPLYRWLTIRATTSSGAATCLRMIRWLREIWLPRSQRTPAAIKEILLRRRMR